MFQLLANTGFDFKRTLIVGVIGGIVGMVIKLGKDFADSRKENKSKTPA